jgi:hypothetical protein
MKRPPLTRPWKDVGCLPRTIDAEYERVRTASGSVEQALSAVMVNVYSPAMFTGGTAG